jgi:hypothetical protein
MVSDSPIKTELVIGMTLAETFLLILFVVWYAQAKKGAVGQPNWQTIAEQREKEANLLRAELARQKQVIQELEKALEYWRTNWGVSPPSSTEELRAALGGSAGKALLQELRRGLPRCEENNVLVAITLRRGAVEMLPMAPSAKLQAWAASSGLRLPPSAALTDWQSIRTFLDTVARFYSDRGRQEKPCRFDYRLEYATKEDYYDAREMFEKYFYPAAIAQVPGP